MILNFEDVKKYFKFRYYSLLVLLALGFVVFLFWAMLFFTAADNVWLDTIHGLGFLYFLLALLCGGVIYAVVLGTVIYRYKEFKSSEKFRTAFYKFTGIFIFSVCLSFGMAMFVTHYASRVVITIRNLSGKTIESALVSYPREKSMEVEQIAIGGRDQIVIFTQGEGSLAIKVKFSDGSSNEKVVIGYLDQTVSRTPFVQLDIKTNDIQLIEVKK